MSQTATSDFCLPCSEMTVRYEPLCWVGLSQKMVGLKAPYCLHKKHRDRQLVLIVSQKHNHTKGLWMRSLTTRALSSLILDFLRECVMEAVALFLKCSGQWPTRESLIFICVCNLKPCESLSVVLGLKESKLCTRKTLTSMSVAESGAIQTVTNTLLSHIWLTFIPIKLHGPHWQPIIHCFIWLYQLINSRGVGDKYKIYATWKLKETITHISLTQEDLWFLFNESHVSTSQWRESGSLATAA